MKQTYVLKTKELLCETLKKKYDFYYNLAVKNVTEKKYTVSRLTVFCKKCVLKNFAKLTGKNLIRRVFFNIFQYWNSLKSDEVMKNMLFKCNLVPDFNSFLADIFVLYLLETLQKLFNFMAFSGGRKLGHCPKIG